jgi:hypothetical protein
MYEREYIYIYVSVVNIYRSADMPDAWRPVDGRDIGYRMDTPNGWEGQNYSMLVYTHE